MESNDLEEWRVVAEAPNYQVSNKGRVKGKTWRISDPKPNPNGYIPISLCVDGKQFFRLAHVLVAKAFIPNPENKPMVNHINGIRGDNHVSNLEWVTAVENRHKRVFHSKGRTARKIVQLTRDGAVIAIWPSINEAANSLGVYPGNISTCCRKKTGTIKGYNWAYFDEHQPPAITEEWRTVEAKGKTYSVSSHGRVKTMKGYTGIGSKCGNYLAFAGILVHRLVAEAFCTKKDGCNVVNHIDANPRNNCATNLEWVTQLQNIRHARALGLISKGNHKLKRAVHQLSNGKTIAMYASLTEAHKSTSINIAHIWDVCRGRRRMAGGYGWAYANPETSVDLAQKTKEEFLMPDDDPYWAELGLEAVDALTLAQAPEINNDSPDFVIPDDDPIWQDLGL